MRLVLILIFQALTSRAFHQPSAPRSSLRSRSAQAQAQKRISKLVLLFTATATATLQHSRLCSSGIHIHTQHQTCFDLPALCCYDKNKPSPFVLCPSAYPPRAIPPAPTIIMAAPQTPEGKQADPQQYSNQSRTEQDNASLHASASPSLSHRSLTFPRSPLGTTLKRHRRC